MKHSPQSGQIGNSNKDMANFLRDAAPIVKVAAELFDGAKTALMIAVSTRIHPIKVQRFLKRLQRQGLSFTRYQGQCKVSGCLEEYYSLDQRQVFAFRKQGYEFMFFNDAI